MAGSAAMYVSGKRGIASGGDPVSFAAPARRTAGHSTREVRHRAALPSALILRPEARMIGPAGAAPIAR